MKEGRKQIEFLNRGFFRAMAKLYEYGFQSGGETTLVPPSPPSMDVSGEPTPTHAQIKDKIKCLLQTEVRLFGNPFLSPNLHPLPLS